MSKWVKQDVERMRHELETIYMLAGMKRAQQRRYGEGGDFIGFIGPESDDPDWDKVIESCERAGLRASTVRASSA